MIIIIDDCYWDSRQLSLWKTHGGATQHYSKELMYSLQLCK